MKIKFINQHKELANHDRGSCFMNRDFDYLWLHQEWNTNESFGYLAFYIVLFGLGVEIII